MEKLGWNVMENGYFTVYKKMKPLNINSFFFSI